MAVESNSDSVFTRGLSIELGVLWHYIVIGFGFDAQFVLTIFDV